MRFKYGWINSTVTVASVAQDRCEGGCGRLRQQEQDWRNHRFFPSQRAISRGLLAPRSWQGAFLTAPFYAPSLSSSLRLWRQRWWWCPRRGSSPRRCPGSRSRTLPGSSASSVLTGSVSVSSPVAGCCDPPEPEKLTELGFGVGLNVWGLLVDQHSGRNH